MKLFSKIIIGYVFLIIFSSCSNLPRQDGAPKQDVDVSQIPNATPKILPKSSCGNPAQYTVNGQTYHVLSTTRGYQAFGIASWYGTKFDQHLASDGEVYNMYEMTAAHKTLPIPCFVRVTNIENHRSIIVKVTDRGPFAPKRIIDLSYVAAKKLGIIAKGTGYVKVETIDPSTFQKGAKKAIKESTVSSKQGVDKPVKKQNHQNLLQAKRLISTSITKSTSKTTAQKKQVFPRKTSQHLTHVLTSPQKIFLQTGIYLSRYNALVAKTHLAAFPTQMDTIQKQGKTLYRIKVGPFSNEGEARECMRKIKGLSVTMESLQHKTDSKARFNKKIK